MDKDISIMIMDDDCGIVDSLKVFLGDKYDVEGATNSLEGLKRLQEKKFDLLVLDYYIDELDGSDVIERVRKFDSNIYTLLLTGYAEDVPALEVLKNLNIQGYCEKSGDFKNVIISIESVIKSIEFFRTKKCTIGQRIKDLRKLNNLSQEDVAKYLKTQKSSISQYESGVVIPPTLTIIKLAKLFNTTTDYILCYELEIEKRI
ncbi:response regulator [Clostridium thailandense]|uniref:Helix-turn-helix domain-containing protein n=1 Tax=Clostridium thailandense TaxID=2794346 RepID=A0A949WQT5_9CLOT|nr:response regulator [Clostridium thailandense]MBV7273156.1 helix-turn-helix domain-containing protein [Clostridium thailandense]MCH5137518.1 helix-turn-helix domain-containing protein [Clostridiaceae bacterium UIB06]